MTKKENENICCMFIYDGLKLPWTFCYKKGGGSIE